MPRDPALERLWAPWRGAYIAGETAKARRARTGSRAEPTAEQCLFCRVGKGSADRADLVVTRRESAFLMLNRYPYNPGHLMVAVLRHTAEFASLTGVERQDLLDLVGVAERLLAASYHPDGVNYGANVGRVAGAGFPGHLHLHLVPRWNGDTNFMPIVARTKVLPESLASTWKRLRLGLGRDAARASRAPRASRRRRRGA